MFDVYSLPAALTFARFARANGIDVREMLEKLFDGEKDFEVDDYRFIQEDSIDSIMLEELSNDEFILGCFNASFLASTIEIDYDVIKSCQDCEAYEAIGKLIKSLDKLEEVQEAYVEADGYGHHFSSYDGVEHTIKDYSIFRLN